MFRNRYISLNPRQNYIRNPLNIFDASLNTLNTRISVSNKEISDYIYEEVPLVDKKEANDEAVEEISDKIFNNEETGDELFNEKEYEVFDEEEIVDNEYEGFNEEEIENSCRHYELPSFLVDDNGANAQYRLHVGDIIYNYDESKANLAEDLSARIHELKLN
ncbi:15980_t:CDS:2 [Funneliformis geosporum]|uniref:15980_t:CDS:1 n=1 Tax=Funneliformis geosporum TaxID=1117311 RepID=A0A9W4SQR2_9GLOM|nr:15980_t:CDS:2 [Funneliformis geosporum]